MNSNDLNNISVEELAKLPVKDLIAAQEKLKVAIEKRKRSEKTELYAKITAIASESGFSTSELADIMVKPPKKVLVAKYRNPHNADEVWSGKGRKPLWLVKAIDEGKTLADLEINA